MKNLRMLGLSLFCLGSFAVLLAQTEPKAAIASEPLTAEPMAIYRDFLGGYNNGSKSTLNLAQTTIAFSPRDYDRTSCLAGFKRAELATPVVHTFAADAFPGVKLRLVDPAAHKRQDPGDAIRRGQSVDEAVTVGFAAGIFTFSEIVFDAAHTHAAFSYSFVCGGLCGHGGTVVYELQDGKWKPSKLRCGSWIS